MEIEDVQRIFDEKRNVRVEVRVTGQLVALDDTKGLFSSAFVVVARLNRDDIADHTGIIPQHDFIVPLSQIEIID